ncbi:hypothetical protein NDU88_005745 [Pleurodeles waltl]|uniref:Uncharacterized protein n=1 Tax=Pleurodeles waltl TaxID=8319 RepID=A0AAV7RN31_PLEWA|nr:hypothetical protein NDU88_005745 [Pleurodeles waltl]
MEGKCISCQTLVLQPTQSSAFSKSTMYAVHSVEKLYLRIRIETCDGNPFMHRLVFPQTFQKQLLSVSKDPKVERTVRSEECCNEHVPQGVSEHSTGVASESTPVQQGQVTGQASLPSSVASLENKAKLQVSMDQGSRLDFSSMMPGLHSLRVVENQDKTKSDAMPEYICELQEPLTNARAESTQEKGTMSLCDNDGISPDTVLEIFAQDKSSILKDTLSLKVDENPLRGILCGMLQEPGKRTPTQNQPTPVHYSSENVTPLQPSPKLQQEACMVSDLVGNIAHTNSSLGPEHPSSPIESPPQLNDCMNQETRTQSQTEMFRNSQVFNYPSPSSVKSYPTINPCYIKTTTRQLSSPTYLSSNSPLHCSNFQCPQEEVSGLLPDPIIQDKFRADKRKKDKLVSNICGLHKCSLMDLPVEKPADHKRQKMSLDLLEYAGVGTKKKHFPMVPSVLPNILTDGALQDKLLPHEDSTQIEADERCCSRIRAMGLLFPFSDCLREQCSPVKERVAATVCHGQPNTLAPIGQARHSLECLQRRSCGRIHTVCPEKPTQQKQLELKYTEADCQAVKKQYEDKLKEAQEKYESKCAQLTAEYSKGLKTLELTVQDLRRQIKQLKMQSMPVVTVQATRELGTRGETTQSSDLWDAKTLNVQCEFSIFIEVKSIHVYGIPVHKEP